MTIKAARPKRNGLLAKIFNCSSLGARQRRTRRTAVVERCQRAVTERVLAWPLGAIKPRHQPGVVAERVGPKATNGGVNVQRARNATLVSGKALVPDLVIGDLVPGTACEDAVLGESNDAVLGMKLRVDALSDIADQRRLVIELTECPQYPVAVTVAGQRKVLPTPDAPGEGDVFDLALHRAAPGHMFEHGKPLVGDFHVRERGRRLR